MTNPCQTDGARQPNRRWFLLGFLPLIGLGGLAFRQRQRENERRRREAQERARQRRLAGGREEDDNDPNDGPDP